MFDYWEYFEISPKGRLPFQQVVGREVVLDGLQVVSGEKSLTAFRAYCVDFSVGVLGLTVATL
jgi:hypothetical protein